MTNQYEDDKQTSVYMDFNATSPLEPDVLHAIHDALDQAWGNPSSTYKAGSKAKAIIDDARSAVASMVGGRSSDIIFTSGGTETNNWVIHTALKHFWSTYPQQSTATNLEVKPHIITSNIEHDSVKLPLEHLEKENKIDVTFVPVSKVTGHLEVSDVLCAVRSTTCLVTTMHANNETGIIQPIADIMRQVQSLKRDPKHEVARILLHTDAAQTIGKIPVNVQDLGVDFMTIVGHKFYGPRIGALYVKGPSDTTPIYPMFYGGGQERNFRPGTENTGMIAGLGKAAELVKMYIEKDENHMREVRDYLEKQLQEMFGSRVVINSRFAQSETLPNTCNVSILGKGLYGHQILGRTKRLQASVGAACHSGKSNRPSPILLAVGTKEDVATNALRLSVGRHTSNGEVDIVIEDLKQAIHSLDKEQDVKEHGSDNG